MSAYVWIFCHLPIIPTVPVPFYVCGCVCVCTLSCAWLFTTPWTVARQAPLSMGFSRQENWSGLPFPPPGDLPSPGIEPVFSFISHADGDSLPLATPGKTVQSFKKLKVEMEFSVAETWGQRLKYFTCFRGVMWTLLYQDTLCQQQKALWGEQVGQGWGTVLWCLPASWTVRWIPDSSPCYFQDLHHCVETPPWLMTRLPPDSSRKPPPGLCGLQLSKLYGGRADGQGF